MRLLPKSLAVCAAVLSAPVVSAQSAPPAAPPPASDCSKVPWFVGMPLPYRSAEVLPDGRATFRLCAPDAHEVLVSSSDAGEAIPMGFMPGQAKGLMLTKDAMGIWSGTTAVPIQPGTYRYSFRVDGVKTPDPMASRWSELRTGIESVLEVPGPAAAFQTWDASIPHGVVSTVTYWSKPLGASRRAHIYTPPGYMKDGRRYPVLYLVHGAGDSDDSWTSIGRADAILDRLIAAGKAVPMIVVMPAGHTPDRPDANILANHDFGNDLVDALIPYVDANFRTVPTPDGRAMAGLSMGGSHTLREGLVRPGTFHWIGIFSMGLGIGRSIQIDQQQVDAYAKDNSAALTEASKAMHLVYYAIGRQDFLYASAAPTRAVMDRFGIHYVYRESDGGHTWLNWRDYLADFAPRLFQPASTGKQ